MAIAPTLLEILACPEDKGPLLYFEAQRLLYNPRLWRKYRVDDNVPHLLDEGATDVDEAEHDQLMEFALHSGLKPTF